MDKISVNMPSFGTAVEVEHQVKNKIKKNFTNYAGVFIGAFIMFAVIVIVTTDITFTSFKDLAALGLDFFLLLFCSYSMYVNCSDSGMRSGLINKNYLDALSKFEEHKQTILAKGYQAVLPDFCHKYIEDELRHSRLEILGAVGITYESYMNYITLSDADVDKLSLSETQIKSIKKANSIKPIKLTPEMIMKRGRGSSKRAPLGIKPENKKLLVFGYKFLTTFCVALMLILVVIDIGAKPAMTVFAECTIRLLSIVMNGFTGYKFGYENIVFDTVGYISDQTDLMRQVINYAESKI
jgi:hypothetical protein